MLMGMIGDKKPVISGSVFISATAAGNPSTPGSVTTAGIDTTGANLIVAMVAMDLGSTPGAVTDNKGNGSYTGLTVISAGSNSRGRLYYFFAPTVGTGHTFTYTGTSSFPAISVAAFSQAVTSPFDTESGAGDAGSPGTHPLGGTVTPSQNNDLIITGCTYGATAATDTSGNPTLGFVTAAHIAAVVGISYGCGIAWLKQTTGAAGVNPQWTISQSDNWACCNASFKGT